MNDVAGLTALFAAASGRPIVPLNDAARQSDSKAPVFFCVHSVTGAGGSDYVDLAHAIGRDVRFFAIQAPKKLMLDCEKLCVEAGFGPMLQFIAKSYADAIEKTHPEGEVNLGGWSAGALVALETAKCLRRKGRTVGLLASFDGAPKKSRSAGPALWYAAKVLGNIPRAFWHRGFAQFGRKLSYILSKFINKTKTRKKNATGFHPVQDWCDWSYYPPYQQNFMMRLYDAVEQADFGVYDGEVVVYRATIQPIALSGVAEFWERMAPKCVIVRALGTHNNLVFKPFVTPLALDLNRRINR